MNPEIVPFLDKIICGDAAEVLRTMPSGSVDCVITSPPYYGLRDYGEQTKTIWGGDKDCQHEWGEPTYGNLRKPTPGDKPAPTSKVAIHRTNAENRPAKPSEFCKKCSAWYGQLGLEPTLEMCLDHMLQITAELKRVLKKTGTMWWNMGDSYSSHSTGQGNVDGIEGERKNKQDNRANVYRKMEYPDKCMLLQNFRLVQRMVDEQQFILRNMIIWWKPSCMPSSADDRFTNDFEPVFFLTKNRDYWFEQQFEPTLTYDENIRDRDVSKLNNTPGRSRMSGLKVNNYSARNKRCVWKISTQPFPFDWCPKCEKPVYNDERGKGFTHSFCGTKLIGHFATFPEKLVEPMIRSGAPEMICKKCMKARRKTFSKSRVNFNVRVRDTKKGYKKSDQYRASEEEIENYRGQNEAIEPIKLLDYTSCDCPEPKEYEAGVVLDCFSGSGTVAVVAKKLGRHYIGIELNEDYVKMSEYRIKALGEPML